MADGGQRPVLPVGSAIIGTEYWAEHLNSGLHLGGGRLLHYEHRSSEFTYIAADLTAAYNTPEHDEAGRGGAVDRVVRRLVYLQDEDRLLISDQVNAVAAEYQKKWLLHTVMRPEVENIRVLKGTADDGILESTADKALVRNGREFLTVQRVYPVDAVIRLVGGEHHAYYIEKDSDETTLDWC